MKDRINDLCRRLGLGALQDAPRPLSGGLMHRMYRVQTESGVYCIKALNPEVMARPEALGNIVRSEKAAQALSSRIPLAAARRFSGESVLQQDGRYFMVFDFVEGASVSPPGLTPQHCAAIGNLLGIIHKADIAVPGIQAGQADAPIFDWEFFAQQTDNQKWAGTYRQAVPDLIRWNREAAAAVPALSICQVISHRDLDPKNVMWQGTQPVVIDWEAAGYTNPYQELFEVCSSWAADPQGSLRTDNLDALIAAYSRHIPLEGLCWQAPAAAGMNGMLGWLEYNLKRALRLIEVPEAEQQLGMEQVSSTLAELQAYQEKSRVIRERLEKAGAVSAADRKC